MLYSSGCANTMICAALNAIWSSNTPDNVNEDFLHIVIISFSVFGLEMFQNILSSCMNNFSHQSIFISESVRSSIMTHASKGDMQKVKNVLKSLYH
jgi:hypothetical protein